MERSGKIKKGRQNDKNIKINDINDVINFFKTNNSKIIKKTIDKDPDIFKDFGITAKDGNIYIKYNVYIMVKDFIPKSVKWFVTDIVCSRCGKLFTRNAKIFREHEKERENKVWKDKLYCDIHCFNDDIRENYSNLYKRYKFEKSGGLNGIFKSKYSGDVRYDSSLELAYLIMQDLNSRNFIKRYNLGSIEYKSCIGTTRNYTPDFILNDNTIIEIKNRYTLERDDKKQKNFNIYTKIAKKYFESIGYEYKIIYNDELFNFSRQSVEDFLYAWSYELGYNIPDDPDSPNKSYIKRKRSFYDISKYKINPNKPQDVAYKIFKEWIDNDPKTRFVPVESNEEFHEKTLVYDLSIENEANDHSYKVNGYTVHNSAAGSLVAYCLGITRGIDPLKYGLLFSRFISAKRIGLPDIDTDFDEDGRSKVIEYCSRKYGPEKVAHIVAYTTMATKSSINDVFRVESIPLSETKPIAALIPDKVIEVVNEDGTVDEKKVNIRNCIKYVPEFKKAYEGEYHQPIEYAAQLEGTVRQTSVHACGLIIGRDDLSLTVPLSVVKDAKTGEEIACVQYDGHVIESTGLIKMDFLGLRTLNIIQETIKNVKLTTGKDITDEINNVDVQDKLTYEKVFQKGNTISVFQFESSGMSTFLKKLAPTQFTDLIAMNALYRPGPIAYVPEFIDRKNGVKPIVYDIPATEEVLKETYGVVVYQEQVMKMSMILADFDGSEADGLRKAMGKKQLKKMLEYREKFLNNGVKNGHPKETLEKIWSDWEAFAKYAFNKSHAACYSYIAFQTAYLKAHYPEEFMAANLTRSMDNIDDITKNLEECKAMGIKIKCPNINISNIDFTPDPKTHSITFGLGGIKSFKKASVNAILEERNANGSFKDIYDLVERTPITASDLKVLSYSGALDSFKGWKRSAIEEPYKSNKCKADELIEWRKKKEKANEKAKSNGGMTLFGDISEIAIDIPKPELHFEIRNCSPIEMLNKERDLVGLYLTMHPVDTDRTSIGFENAGIRDLMKNKQVFTGTEKSLKCLITDKEIRQYNDGTRGLILKVEDKTGSGEIKLYNEKIGIWDFVNIGDIVYFKAYGNLYNDKLYINYSNPKWPGDLQKNEEFDWPKRKRKNN